MQLVTVEASYCRAVISTDGDRSALSANTAVIPMRLRVSQLTISLFVASHSPLPIIPTVAMFTNRALRNTITYIGHY